MPKQSTKATAAASRANGARGGRPPAKPIREVKRILCDPDDCPGVTISYEFDCITLEFNNFNYPCWIVRLPQGIGFSIDVLGNRPDLLHTFATRKLRKVTAVIFG